MVAAQSFPDLKPFFTLFLPVSGAVLKEIERFRHSKKVGRGCRYESNGLESVAFWLTALAPLLSPSTLSLVT